MDCSICCEQFNKSTHLKIQCKTCEDPSIIACQACAKRYILELPSEPACMICKIEWEHEFLCEYFPKVFINKQLKEHRQNILVEKQIAKLPETQEYASKVKLIDGLNTQSRILTQKKNNLLQEVAIIKNSLRDINETIANLRLDYNSNVNKPEKCSFTFKCPLDDCNGFLDEKHLCGICDNKICVKCMEVKEDDHECNEDLKATISLLKKDTKGCPKCGQLIYKISGCDQMWCPPCNTAFSWKTGHVETGTVHNPEYYRWMRESGQTLERNPQDVPYDPCGNNLPTYQRLITMMRLLFPSKIENNRFVDLSETIEVSNMHRITGHIRLIERNAMADEGAKETYYRNLRADFLLNRITKEEFKFKLQKDDKKRNKDKKLVNIWTLLNIEITEYLGKMCEPNMTRESIQELLKNSKKIQTFCNSAFEKVGNMYNNTYPGITNGWIHVYNWEAHIKEQKNKNKNKN